MPFLLGLVAGLIIGWVIEWIIDWQYWRAEDEDDTGSALDTDMDLRAELDRARLEIVALRNKIERYDAQPDTRTGGADRLQIIKGIGPVFAQRLNDAGINTFAQLAAASPDTVIEAVDAQEWQAVDPSAWIDAARELAARSGEGV